MIGGFSKAFVYPFKYNLVNVLPPDTCGSNCNQSISTSLAPIDLGVTTPVRYPLSSLSNASLLNPSAANEN